MDEVTKLKFLLGVYGSMQNELIFMDLVEEKGGKIIKVKKMTLSETDAIAIYKFIYNKVNHLSVAQVGEYAERTNEILKVLLNDKTLAINNFLLSMMLYRNYLDDIASTYEKNMMMPKVNRCIELFEGFKDEEYKMIRKNTARAADNIWKVWIGEQQLSDADRDARFKRILHVDKKN